MTVAARLLAVLEAQTANFDARLAASAVVMDKMTRSQVIAHRATGQMRNALQGVALQAFGMIGPAGQAANSLLALAGGMHALVAAGAAGAVALLIMKATKEIEEATKRSDELAASWRQLAAVRIGSPLLLRLSEQEPRVAERDLLAEKVRGRTSDLTEQARGINAPLDFFTKGDVLLQQWNSQLTSLNAIIDEIGRKPEHVLLGMRRELQLMNAPLEESLRLQAQWAGLVGDTADEFVRLRQALIVAPLLEEGRRIQVDIARALAMAPTMFAQLKLPTFGRFVTPTMTGTEGLPAIDTSPGAHFLGDVSGRAALFEQLRQAEQQRAEIMAIAADETVMASLAAAGLSEEFNAMVRSMNRAEVKSQQLAIAIITSVSSAIQAVVSGGGPGSILSAGGGILSALATQHPSLLVPGLILGSLGGIVSAFDNAEERRTQRVVDAIERMAKEVGLERLTVVFTGPDGHQVRKSLAELESGDAVERVPGPVGATG
jgi:hypothetical protein